MHRELSFGTGAVLVVLTATLGSAPGRILGRSPNTQEQKPSPSKSPDRTTPIQRLMTSDQRKHAKLQGLRSCRVRLLDEQLSTEVFSEPFFDDKPHPPAEEIIAAMACGSDAVFIGTSSRSTSFPTDDGCWLFTDSEIEVERTYRVPTTGAFAVGDHVVVSLSGGSMMVDGERVFAKNHYGPELAENRRYFVALTYDAGSKAFYLKGASNDVLEARGERFYSFWPTQTREGVLSEDGIAASTLMEKLASVKCR
ncbi:MAG: hypothetical protein NTV05_06990 [Acidobacteria bacterium]|nr:hypothetical protein [Acidobacteriota bacterium]